MPELMSTQDLADALSIPPRTAEQWRYLGTGPRYVRVGRHVRYRRADVDAWLSAQTVEPTPAA